MSLALFYKVARGVPTRGLWEMIKRVGTPRSTLGFIVGND